jgi:hypothetical protein
MPLHKASSPILVSFMHPFADKEFKNFNVVDKVTKNISVKAEIELTSSFRIIGHLFAIEQPPTSDIKQHPVNIASSSLL